MNKFKSIQFLPKLKESLYEFSESIWSVDNAVETLSKILENALNSSSNKTEIELEFEMT
jgi:hypothetical protein